MLTIKIPRVENKNHILKVIYPLIIDGVETEFWFCVESKYENYLTIDRSDGILVMVLIYALHGGHNIKLELPISEKLYYQIKYHLLPALTSELTIEGLSPSPIKYGPITIDAPPPVKEAYPSGECVGTGMSCGVDSIFTYYFHNFIQNVESQKVNILTFMNLGGFSFVDGTDIIGKSGKRLYEEKLIIAENFAKEANLSLFNVDSNFAEVFKGCRYDWGFTFILSGLILCFQRMFKVYYLSSAYSINSFNVAKEIVSSYFDIFALPNISTICTTFYSSVAAYNRFSKVSLITDYNIAHRLLSVCTVEDMSCGKCAKCVRMMVNLDALGKLDLFSEIYDLNEYRRRRIRHIGYAIAQRGKWFNESVILLRKAGKIPFLSYFHAIPFLLFKPIEYFLRNKLSVKSRVKILSLSRQLGIKIPKFFQ